VKTVTTGVWTCERRESRWRAALWPPTWDAEQRRFAYVCVTPATLVILGFQLIPLLYALYITTHRYSLVSTPMFVWADNYIQLFSALGLSILWNTFLFTMVTVVVSFAAGMALALLLYTDVPGGAVFRALLLLPLLVSPVVSGTTWAFIFNDEYGIVNRVLDALGHGRVGWLSDPDKAMWIVILVGIWMKIPFFTILLFAGLQAIPRELFESADIDGAGWWQRLRLVTTPMLMPIIMVSVIIQALEGVTVFDIVYVVTFGGPGRASEVLSLYAYKEAFSFFNIGYGTTVAIVTAAIALGVGALLYRLFTAQMRRYGY
jgi:multiple sugar transport system permease protein